MPINCSVGGQINRRDTVQVYPTFNFLTMPDKSLTFDALQEHADSLESSYVSQLEDLKKLEAEFKALEEKLNATKMDSMFSAASWRGLNELAKSVFGKELISRASKEEEPKEEVTVEKDNKESEKSKL